MTTDPHPTSPLPPPSRRFSVAVFLVIVGLLAWVQLGLYSDKIFPLGYVIPLLICLWHRDRILLWSMTVMFLAIQFIATPNKIPIASRPDWPPWVFVAIQLLNTLVPALIIHAWIDVCDRLELRNKALGEVNAELEAGNEELAAREEEISRQNEELRAQTEELEHQSSELRQQAEELTVAHAERARREVTLQTLLELTGPQTSEAAALCRICELTPQLLGGNVIAAVLLERQGQDLLIHAHSGFADRGLEQTRLPLSRSFAGLVLRQGQTAYLRDTKLRPDMEVPRALGGDKFGSILAAPLRLRGQLAGVLEAFTSGPHDWTDEQTRLMEWLAGQASELWESIRRRQEHARAEAVVRETAQTLKFHLENSPLGIVEWDPEFVITRWTGQAQEIFGWSAAEVVGQRINRLHLVTRQDRIQVWQAINHLVRGAVGINVNTSCNLRKDGREIVCEWYSSALRDPDGQLLSVLSYVLDVTARTQAQEALRQLTETLERQVAERTAVAEQRATQLQALASELTQTEHRERRRLAQLLHDDLQQLLAAARMHLSLIPDQPEQPEGREALAAADELLGQAIESARSLTVELSPPILFEQRLAVAFGWLARQMQEKHALAVTVEERVETDSPAEEVRVLLFQAVRELLFNTVKHAGIREARVLLDAEGDNQIKVIVEDCGSGFNPSALKKEPPQGGGFGLFSIRERLGLLGGTMRIDSGSGRGCRVTLTAPLRLGAAAAPAVSSPAPAALLSPPGKERTIDQVPAAPPASNGAAGRLVRVMLVDDHRLLRDGLAELLRTQADIQVVGEAADGLSAVEMARQLHPDVVVMDVGMPRMNGIEATRRITAEQTGVRIIGLSMHEETDMASAMRAAGASDYLTKGGPSELLIDAIRAAALMPPADERA